MPSASTLIAIGGVFGILVALTRRPLTAALLCLYLLVSVLISSAVMQSFLGMPLTLADVQFFFLDPLDDLKLFLNYPALGMSFLTIIGGAVTLLIFGLKLERVRWPGPATPLAHTLRLAIPAVLLLMLGRAYGNAAQPTHGGTVDDREAWSAFLAMRRLELASHWVERLNVFFDNRDMLATLPPPHLQTRFPLPSAPGTAVTDTPRALPDILMVLEESTFDPRLIAKCRYAPCDSPMFRPPAGPWRSLQSPLLVHTTGGGTWLTEFAFLSGFDWRIFGRGGAYAPVSLAPRLEFSLPKYLRSLGYHTVVFSGVGADFLRARSAYRYYGFDEFYAAQDLKLSDDWHAVRDSIVFNKALQLLAQRPDTQPLFVFILTIRNHGPHGEGRDPLTRTVRQVEVKLGRPLADYLSRLDDSAQDMAQLRRTWLSSPRPRVLGWFGDHQPEFAWDYLNTMADIDRSHFATNASASHLRFLTYHQLNANFGEATADTSLAALDVPFLATELLEFSGVPLDAGMQATSAVSAQCKRLLLDCADKSLIDDFISYRIHELHAVR
jgi:hypothetical protein